MLLDIKQVDKSRLKSNVLKEYLAFKEENAEAILLFQIGGFWETFFHDAKIFSEITGVTLGTRKIKDTGEILQAGIPLHTLDLYIKKILNEDYKVCLCAQFQNDDNEFYREITRTYTKGTIIENEFLDSTENNYIALIYKEQDIYQLIYADVSTGQFYKTKGHFEQISIEIEKVEPNELLVFKGQESIFKDIISKNNTTFLDDLEYKDCKSENALVRYYKLNQKSYSVELDKIIEYNIESFLAMDHITRRNLELTRTRRFLKKKGSLVWFLNYTKTPMGSRLLKKYVSEPLLDVEKIKKRQDAVEELVCNRRLLESTEQILEHFCDLSRMCAKISNSTIFPKDLFQIVTNSKSLEDIYNICTKFNSPLLKVNRNKLSETLRLASKIKSAIKENSPNEITKGGIINEGYDAHLDYLRSKLNNSFEELDKYEASEKKRLDIEKLKIDSSNAIGYYIEIPASRINKVPKEYLRKQALTSCSRYTTEKLKKIETEIFNLKFQINGLEYDLYCDIRKQAAKFVEIIRKLANDIARIDVLASYSRAAIINGLTRPDFNSDGIFIKNGFHPSLIKLKNEVVKNDTNLSNGSMIILTGANMSGKSTYLKYNAIICLLSQIGSFIPADSANLTITDKIFIRQGSTDDIINNNSSFMVEMNDLKFILDNITNSSIVMLDEPAKSTNAQEGGAIARAFCEYLLSKHSAKVILATHNCELTKLEEQFPSRALNYVIGNADLSQITINDRKIKRGIMSSSMAINTAILANLPAEIISHARNYLNQQKQFI